LSSIDIPDFYSRRFFRSIASFDIFCFEFFGDEEEEDLDEEEPLLLPDEE